MPSKVLNRNAIQGRPALDPIFRYLRRGQNDAAMEASAVWIDPDLDKLPESFKHEMHGHITPFGKAVGLASLQNPARKPFLFAEAPWSAAEWAVALRFVELLQAQPDRHGTYLPT